MMKSWPLIYIFIYSCVSITLNTALCSEKSAQTQNPVSEKLLELKKLLSKEDGSFYIITVTNDTKGTINSLDRKFLEIILDFLINNKERNLQKELTVEFNKMKDQHQKYIEYNNKYKNIFDKEDADNTQLNNEEIVEKEFYGLSLCDSLFLKERSVYEINAIIKPYERLYKQIKESLQNKQIMNSNSPGMVIFQEYSFGTALFTELDSSKVSQQFSLINPNMIWALNYLKGDKVADNYSALYTQYQEASSERVNPTEPFSDMERFTYKMNGIDGKNYLISNCTDFYVNNERISQYLKNTDASEKMSLEGKQYNGSGFLYKYGNSDIVYNNDEFKPVMKDLFSWRVCKDYSYIYNLHAEAECLLRVLENAQKTTNFIDSTKESMSNNNTENYTKNVSLLLDILKNIKNEIQETPEKVSSIVDFLERSQKPIQILQANSARPICYDNLTKTNEEKYKDLDNFQYFINSTADEHSKWFDKDEIASVYKKDNDVVKLLLPIAVIGYKTTKYSGYTITIHKIGERDEVLTTDKKQNKTKIKKYVKKREMLGKSEKTANEINFLLNADQDLVINTKKNIKTIIKNGENVDWDGLIHMEEEDVINIEGVVITKDNDRIWIYDGEIQLINPTEEQNEDIILKILSN